MKPLEGIKVLDFTQFLAGPLCTMYLSDMGAEVIKLENPNSAGDMTRYTPCIINESGSNYATKNRSKKSVLMNLKDDRQKQLFFKMVETADVVIENFKPGTMEKYGVTYDVLKKINPRIVFTSVSGYGQTGPFRDLPGVDGALQAASGFMSLTGLNNVPTQAGPPIADAVAALTAAIATLGAVVGAIRTGEGRRVDIAMMDAMIPTYENIVTRYNVTGEIPAPVGNRHPTATPMQVFDFKNGEKMYVCGGNDQEFVRFCDAIGHNEWLENPKYASANQRFINRDELIGEIQNIFKDIDADEFSKVLREHKLVFSKLNNIKQVVEHPQVAARNMMVKVKYPNGVEYKVPGCPLKMDGYEEETEFSADPLGYHTIEVMSQYADPATVHEIYDEVLEKASQLAKNKYSKS